MFLSMDFGTSSLKMALVRADLSIIRSAKAEYHYNIPHESWVELAPDTVLAAMRLAAEALGSEMGRVDHVVFDTFSPSPVFLDENGHSLYPIITHLDRRSKAQTQRIVHEMGEHAFQQITGILPFTGGASITTFLWMLEHEKSVMDQAYMVGHLSTFIYHTLTGLWATDPVNASQSGMYETVAGTGWSKPICKAFGIPMEKLPNVLPAGTAGGRLTKEAAALLGLREGIPVALGTNDAAAAQVGAGNTHSGDILNISGSSEMISILSDKAAVNKHYYLRCSATAGLWQVYATTASGFAVEWFRKTFCNDLSEREFYDVELVQAMEQARRGESVAFSPYIAGDRQSLISKTASFSNITLHSQRRDFLSGILLGIHQPILETLELAKKITPLNSHIILNGGMLSDEFIALKQHLMPGFHFLVKHNCPLLGNVRLAASK